MHSAMTAVDPVVEARARQSLGTSHDAIYRMIQRALEERRISGGRFVDVGCGSGSLWPFVANRFERYSGLDAARYEGFPGNGEFHAVDLDASEWPVPAGSGDVVAAIETIEHLENPWAFVRALATIAAPGGWVAVTTPNQLSALSLITLLAKRRFSAFQDSHFPAHRTALLETDLQRIFGEAGLGDIEVCYSRHGRIPLTPWHYPGVLSAIAPRRLSDNILIIGRRDRG